MTNKPNPHLDLPETEAATPTSSSLNIETGAPTKTPPSLRLKTSTPENPLLAAISEVTIPVLAQTFKLTPAAISSWVTNKHVPWGHLARLSDLTTIPLPELLDANSQSPKQEFRGAKRPLALLEDLAKLPSPTEDDLQTLAHTHNIELRTQRFTDLLLPIGLTWHAIEQMSDYHRDAFYQLLLMKQPE